MTSEQYMVMGYIVALGVPMVYALLVFSGLRRARHQQESRSSKL